MKAIENHLYMMGAIKLRLPLHLSPEMETGQLGPETTRTKTTRTTFKTTRTTLWTTRTNF